MNLHTNLDLTPRTAKEQNWDEKFEKPETLSQEMKPKLSKKTKVG